MKILLFLLLQSVCVNPQHAHQVSDMRMMKTQIEKVTDCGLRIMDLENQSVDVDVYPFDANFAFGKAVFLTGKTETIDAPKKDMKVGQRGLLIYCVHCKAVMTFILQEFNSDAKKN